MAVSALKYLRSSSSGPGAVVCKVVNSLTVRDCSPFEPSLALPWLSVCPSQVTVEGGADNRSLQPPVAQVTLLYTNCPRAIICKASKYQDIRIDCPPSEPPLFPP